MSFPMHMSELDVLTLEYLEPENQREVSASRTLIPWQRYAKNREQTKSSTPGSRNQFKKVVLLDWFQLGRRERTTHPLLTLSTGGLPYILDVRLGSRGRTRASLTINLQR